MRKNILRHSYSKYCPEHRQDRYRIRKRTKPEDVNIKNQTYKHNYTEVVTMVLSCALEACDNQFEVKVYPRQYIYPNTSRPPQRVQEIRHLQQIGREDLIEQMMKEGEMMEIEAASLEKGKEDEENLELIDVVA